jgi:hypothetical protein
VAMTKPAMARSYLFDTSLPTHELTRQRARPASGLLRCEAQFTCTFEGPDP